MSTPAAASAPKTENEFFKALADSNVIDTFLYEYAETNECNFADAAYPQWDISIGQVPREISEFIELETPDKDGEAYDDLGSLDVHIEDSTEDHGEDGGASSQVLLITEPIPADAYDNFQMPWPYRFMASGTISWPSYCDDESDGWFNGQIALIPDDADLMGKLEAEHHDAVAKEIHSQFAEKVRQILRMRPQDVLLCGKEIEALNRSYARALKPAEEKDGQPEPRVKITSESATTAGQDPYSIIAAQVAKLKALPVGETAYLNMEGDYHEMCQDIASAVQAQVDGFAYVSGVWGVGGIPDAREVILVINPELDDQKDGAMSINDEGKITWRPRHNQSYVFQSETDQIIASSDPWRLIEDLLGLGASERWSNLAQRLSIAPKLTKVSERMIISEIEFERQ